MYDAEVTESLLRSIEVTHKLKRLTLHRINVTSSPAVEFINNLFKKAPNLWQLDMSYNPLLGAGVDSLIKHLSCAPHLEQLELRGVKMTPQQVMDLSSAIKQHRNITQLDSSYHVSFPILSQFVSLFFVYSLFKKAPNLVWLDMSGNPLLGAGVDSLIKHLSCAPHLKRLSLEGVKMTPQQVMDLSSAFKQPGNITYLGSSYHVSFPILS